MAKAISVSDETYQYVKGYADANGMTLREAMGEMVSSFRQGQRIRAEKFEYSPEALSVDVIDHAQGYERKPDEVTARDGLAALYAISRGSKNDMGIDRS